MPFSGLSCAYLVFSYEDFFGAEKRKVPKQKPELSSGSEESDIGNEQEDAEAVENQVLFSLYAIWSSKEIYGLTLCLVAVKSRIIVSSAFSYNEPDLIVFY